MSLLKTFATYRFSRYFKLLFVLWDLILLNSAILLSFMLRYGNFDRMAFKEVQTVWLLSNLIWFGILFYKDAYRIIRIERIESILIRMTGHIVIHIGLIAVIVGLLGYTKVSRLRLLCFYMVFFLLLLLSRVAFMKFMKYVRAQGYNFKNVIIVGVNDAGRNIAKILSKDLTFGYRILGFFDEKVDLFAAVSAPILGGFDGIKDYVAKVNVDEMYIALHIDNIKIIQQLTILCERHMIRIKFIPDFQQYTRSRKVEITFYENTPVLMLRKEPLEAMPNLLMKKVFDFVFSFAVIVLVFPWLLPIMIVLIKIDSPGPVFFRQRRSGRGKKEFWCVKFRTMRVNKFSDSIQATNGDSRVTKIGAFMRKTNIDELPQFFNVLWGTMSVIGPRPHMLMHTEQYSGLINNYLVRHYAKPGISGWAQVNGFRGETKELGEMKDRVDFDIWYIENWSLILDIKIIYLTIFNVFKGEEKAY
jgi:putative colanic acid biosynthesis UDP-glucose lipid carrier transferase